MHSHIFERQRQKIMQSYGKLPLMFYANHGQVDDQIKFYCKGNGFRYAFCATKVVFTLFGSSDDQSMHSTNQANEKHQETIKGSTVNWTFLQPSDQIKVEGKTKTAGTGNFFLSNDPKQWQTKVPIYKDIIYRNVWQGIDCVWKDEKGDVKYDMIVHPHGSIGDIQILCEGVESVEQIEDGSLRFHTPNGTFHKCKPIVYQIINGVRKSVVLLSIYIN
ncbi:hypothetical protein [Cytobacillus sp. IB215665]|uniref:DUF7948 domain-containing protein n=1 Tax=Cytobacillus sp. IB215665 TaxID=3097357 RepID=UPI002A0BB017|nr:hypothetical protein [Cytobacillus sp. IB215665]MDX8367214.1 hypothetical protein [Cytobacillus sp. IB215665]